ncbi:hypothetical protein [Yokenella regensburgei]|uniref:hypothetical protein n=1 Tax=Yokenella regensburgei TaxID=158877 RepID=UPI0014328EF2|nr:hypothetical protein [Yokenella regensburgei]QIU92177.1 hypothetical protein HEC60_01500 [Yokenella regensburgei]
MMNTNDIATRIADVIISPDAAIGLIHGVMSVPIDIGYLVYGYLDTDSHYSHQTERIRIARAIERGVLNHDRIIDAVQIILTEFNKYIPESKQNILYSRSLFSIFGRIITNSMLSSKIATTIAERASVLVAIRGGAVGNFLLIGGMIERCIRTSEQLGLEEPQVYSLLRVRDYDLLYFLFEPALKPFIDALAVRRNQGNSSFMNILKIVEDKISSHHKIILES